MTTSTRGDLSCTLPFELVVSVLEDCEITSLYPCSLVCRSWVPSCRSRLFKSFKIGNKPPGRCVGLASILSSSHTTIPQHIQNLEFDFENDLYQLEAVRPGSKSDDGGEGLRCTDFLRIICRRLKGRVPSLQKLTMVCTHRSILWELGSGTHPVAFEFFSSFGHIVELNLQLRNERPHDFISFVCSFPCIQTFSMHSDLLDSFTPTIDMILSQYSYSLPTSLQTLRLGGAYEGVYTDSLILFDRWIHASFPARLCSLSVYKAYIGVALETPLLPNIGPLLAQCQDLQFLHIGMDSRWTGYFFPNLLLFYDLSTPQRLERLAISARNIVQNDRSSGSLLTLISRTINTLTSHHPRSIIFNISGYGFRVHHEKWDALDALLATAKFASVVIELVIPFSDLTQSDGTEEEDLPRARQLFTRCDKQGRLVVIRAPFVVTTRNWAERHGMRRMSRTGR